MNYKMIIAYDGTRYNGWQKLGDTKNTIQEKIETVLSTLIGEPVDVHGAGRTDAGVHAKGQTAQFRLPDHTDAAVYDRLREACPALCNTMITEPGHRDPAPTEVPFEEALRTALNRYLPDDIGILSVEEAPPRFHSRYNASGKLYTYRITTDLSKHVFDRKYITRHEGTLDVNAMRQAAEYFVGTHDFKSFCGNPKMKKSTIRTIFSIRIAEQEDDITLYFHGEGFLQYMVRILTGTLIEVGEGLRDPDSMPHILDALDRKAAGKTAPPEGLTLTEVYYE